MNYRREYYTAVKFSYIFNNIDESLKHYIQWKSQISIFYDILEILKQNQSLMI